jgi:glutathionyl-hydroquinone reductase
MGQLVDGVWRTENVLTNHDAKGLYYKRPSIFRDRISSEPQAAFPAEAGRYHLYCAVACPWAHRATLMRTLKKLEPFVTLTNTFQEVGGEGWSFGEGGHVVPGTDRRVRWLHELYTLADHSHLQYGVFGRRRADAGLLPGTAAFRDRRFQCSGAQGYQQCRQWLRLFDLAGGLR